MDFYDVKKMFKQIISGGSGDYLIVVPIIDYLVASKMISIELITDQKQIENLASQFNQNIAYKSKKDIYKESCKDLLLINQMSELFAFSKPKNEDFYDEIRYFENQSDYFESVVDRLPLLFGMPKVSPSFIFDSFTRKENFCNINIIPNWLYEKYRYLICFQRISSAGKLTDGTYAKEWPKHLTNEFIQLCHEFKIGVINIEPADKNQLPYDYDISHLNIKDVACAFKSVNAFVGIDSCFGHACALTKIPSITLYTFNGIKKDRIFEYLPISMNYSIIPAYLNSKKISAIKVFTILQEIILGDRKLEDGYISLKEKKEGIHFEFVI
jgi:hypothetical protein